MFHIRQYECHQSPKIVGMVVDTQMDQFMDDHVLNQRWFQHHHPPVEPQRTVWCTASPPLALISNQYPWFITAVAQTGPPTLNAGPQAFVSPASVPVHNGAADVLKAIPFFKAIWYRNPETPVVKADLRGVHVRRLDN
jgi:hypothetical protein